MSLHFGTVRPREELSNAEPIGVPMAERRASPWPEAKVAPRAVVDAAARAERIVAEAHERAAAILREAEAERAALRERLHAEAREEAAATLASRTLALAAREAAADEQALNRSIELARLLAERLLGEALALDPTRVVALAETALAEARGARRVVLVAHPLDAPLLERAAAEGRLAHVVRVVPEPSRARGSVRLESELGVLDAELAPQLDRLLERLRESLLHER